jgi:hypothetical protein
MPNKQLSEVLSLCGAKTLLAFLLADNLFFLEYFCEEFFFSYLMPFFIDVYLYHADLNLALLELVEGPQHNLLHVPSVPENHQ